MIESGLQIDEPSTGVYLERAGFRMMTGTAISLISVAGGLFLAWNDPDQSNTAIGVMAVGSTIGLGVTLSGYGQLRLAGIELQKQESE